MWFLPIDILKIKSNLSVDAMCAMLLDVIDVNGYAVIRMAPPPNHKPYRGTFDARNFTIMRWIHYKNPFLPLIMGKVVEEKEVGIVRIFMIPNPVGLIVWLIVLSLPFSWFDQRALQFAAMFFIYVFVLLVYKAEAIFSMDFFKGMFK